MTSRVRFVDMLGVTKRFPGVTALDQVDFHLTPGEIHALVGENGSGKSTLMRILGGWHKADAGEIKVDGQTARFANPGAALREGIVVITQEISLVPHLSVAENVCLGQRCGRWVRWKEMRRKAGRILEELQVDLDLETPVAELPPDLQQMVEIARALSLNAGVLVMDEPTSSLTEDEVEALFRVTRSLKERGVSIVFISHKLNEVFALADCATILRDGHVVCSHPIAEFDEEKLVSLMVGRQLDDYYAKVVAAPGEVMLEVDRLSESSIVKEGVTFSVRAGEVVGVAGLVGSGTTELAESIVGLRKRQSGVVRVAGEDVSPSSPAHALRSGIVLVPEDRKRQGLVLTLTLRENMMLGRERNPQGLRWVNRRSEIATVQDYMDRLRIGAPDGEVMVSTLSGGNQQKVVLGRSLVAKPQVLILDEPTRGIDVGAKAEIYRLMGEMAQSGMAVLMISSELPEILGMSDRVLVMFRGRLVAELTRDEATEERIAHYATGGVT